MRQLRSTKVKHLTFLLFISSKRDSRWHKNCCTVSMPYLLVELTLNVMEDKMVDTLSVWLRLENALVTSIGVAVIEYLVR